MSSLTRTTQIQLLKQFLVRLGPTCLAANDGTDFPVGLERLELHDTPHTCCCSGVPGDSEASTKETQGQDEAQKVDALAVLWQVSLSMQLSPRRSQTERVVDLLASYRYMGSQLQAWKAFSTALSCSTCPL